VYIKRTLSLALGSAFLLLSNNVVLAQDDCVECHKKENPKLIKEYEASLHAVNKKKKTTCVDCHGKAHQTAEDHKQATLPTAETCGECHKLQLQDLRSSKHNLAWFGMKSQIAWHGQPGAIVHLGCSGCHKIGQKGLMGIRQGVQGEVQYDGGEEESHYRYGNTQCDACHTRHSFSKSEAQSPRTCSNCHRGSRHPQWETYVSSKHGIIWENEGHQNVDGRAPTCQTCHLPKTLKVVKDKNGKVVKNKDGSDKTYLSTHGVVTSWGFWGLRFPTKYNVLALIEKAPALEQNLKDLAKLLPDDKYIDLDDDSDWTLDRLRIWQALGLLDDGFQPTKRFIEIVSQGEAMRRPEPFNESRSDMKGICNECHGGPYVNKHFKASDAVIKASDAKVAQAISAVQALYKDGILEKPNGWEYAPDVLRYYEAKTKIEQELYQLILGYRQHAFKGAFHTSQDYMHWYGWAPLNSSVNLILEEAKHLREEHKAKHR